MLISKRGSLGLKYLNDSKVFPEYTNDVDDICNRIEQCNPNKKRKILIAFDDIIVDMLNNKKRNPIVTELFIEGMQLIISVAFIAQSYLAVPNNIRLNSWQYFITKIPNRNKLQNIAINHSSDNWF